MASLEVTAVGSAIIVDDADTIRLTSRKDDIEQAKNNNGVATIEVTYQFGVRKEINKKM